MATSGAFQFQSPQNVEIITDAYERVQVLAGEINEEKVLTAARSLNFILSSWINKGLNLWSVKKEMIGLYPNQNTYNLPIATSDILEATVRTSIRNLGGNAFASSGVAQNAFDNNPATACTQNAPNGNIGYTWGQSQYAIAMVGIQSNTTVTYKLVFEYSNDNNNWIQVGSPTAQVFPEGTLIWFVILVPNLGTSFRIRETGGETLNIQELYFNTSLNDTVMTRCSRAEYVAYPNKNTLGKPANFYVDRQANPVLVIYPTPTSQWNNLFYTRVQMPEDIGSMSQNPPIPSRFLEAITSALAFRLGVKEGKGTDVIQMLKSLADEEYALARQEDIERVPLRIYGSFMQGWTSV